MAAGSIKAWLKRLLDLWVTLFGHRSVWQWHRQTGAYSMQLRDTLAAFDERAAARSDPADDPEAPVFILSAGWRSGSTLLQRLVTSGEDTLMWGEPFGDTGFIEYLSEPLRRINRQWPPTSNFMAPDTETQVLKEQWIANLYPSLEDLRSSYRAMFDRLFAQPAYQQGASNWGLKEVRLDADHACFLKWLYPRCKIIFLVRDPAAAYRSYAKFKRWYHIRPQAPVFTCHRFARHWKKLAASYVEAEQPLDAICVRYEDLVESNAQLDAIEAYLGVTLDRSVLEKRIKSQGDSGGYRLAWGELWLLKKIVAPVAARYGYNP